MSKNNVITDKFILTDNVVLLPQEENSIRAYMADRVATFYIDNPDNYEDFPDTMEFVFVKGMTFKDYSYVTYINNKGDPKTFSIIKPLKNPENADIPYFLIAADGNRDVVGIVKSTYRIQDSLGIDYIDMKSPIIANYHYIIHMGED